jgi:hypothetical protein
MADQYHEANRRRWDAGSASWADRADTRGIWKRCHLDPSLALHSRPMSQALRLVLATIASIGGMALEFIADKYRGQHCQRRYPVLA